MAINQSINRASDPLVGLSIYITRISARSASNEENSFKDMRLVLGGERGNGVIGEEIDPILIAL